MTDTDATIQEMMEIEPEALARLVTAGTQLVDQSLGGDAESLVPNLLVVYRMPPDLGLKLDVNTLHVPFNSAQEKNAVLFQLGQRYFASRLLPLAWLLTSEAWRSSETDGKRRYLLPEDDPEREEVAIAFLMTLPGKCLQSFRPLARREGKLHAAGEWQAQDGDVQSPLLEQFGRGFFATCRRPA